MFLFKFITVLIGLIGMFCFLTCITSIVELLQIANMQQVSSNPQGQTKGVSFVGRIAATAGNVTTAGALQTNHMNQTSKLSTYILIKQVFAFLNLKNHA